MSWSGGARKPEGFYDKKFYDKKDGTLQITSNRTKHEKTPFKIRNPIQHKARHRGRHMDLDLRGILDENIVMSVTGNNRSIVHRGGAQLQPYKKVCLVGASEITSHLASNPSHGYRITIPYGHKYSKEFVLNSLHNLLAPDTFVPIMYKASNHFVVFYVDDQRISEKLEACDKKVTGADGFKMRVRVTPGFPRYELDDELRDRMKSAILKKYVPEMNALDLSLFHHNPDLVDDYYCSLTRTPILNTVLKIVVNSLPNLVEISLDNNQLHSLDKLQLLTKLPDLKILGICDNKIKQMDQLDAIQKLKLEELRLAGNPVSRKYNGRQDEYVSDVRKRFPDLLRLDGVALPAVISFDLANLRISLPSAQRLFAPNDAVREVAMEFMQQYFRIFDSDNRQPLLHAYDEHASFSITVSLVYVEHKSNTFWPDNRNLCKVLDETRRRKLLKQGRLPVVACISELPRTQHDPSSFTMDIGLVTETMMLVTVTGLLKEIEAVDQPVRYFTRTFVIVPRGGGYCIINEMLQILKPTKRQVQEAFQSSSPTTTTAMTTTTTTTMTEVSAPAGTITDEVRAQMTAALRERTNMTLEWTLKCLNDVQWDFNTALAAFQACRDRGDIPADAFEK